MQLTHSAVLAAAFEKCLPAAHRSQDDAPKAATEPAEHGEQTVAPATLE